MCKQRNTVARLNQINSTPDPIQSFLIDTKVNELRREYELLEECLGIDQIESIGANDTFAYYLRPVSYCTLAERLW